MGEPLTWHVVRQAPPDLGRSQLDCVGAAERRGELGEGAASEHEDVRRRERVQVLERACGRPVERREVQLQLGQRVRQRREPRAKPMEYTRNVWTAVE